MGVSKIQELKDIYLFGKAQAIKGKRLIDGYLIKGDSEGLKYLLRYHNEGNKISNRETWLRDEVDYYLEYFSILGLAYSTGYLTRSELRDIEDEILLYLGNAHIMRYYTVNYELIFPQILFESVFYGANFKNQNENLKLEQEFENFHTLNQTIENDDVNQFLWFLDGGANGGSNIEDLKDVLQHPLSVSQLLSRQADSALKQSVTGFFEYLTFLERLDSFLNGIENENHKAAYWYYFEYWFKKIRKRLKSTLEKWYDGLNVYARGEEWYHIIEHIERVGEIEASRNDYLQLLDRIVFNDTFKIAFERYLQSWRFRNGGG